RLNHQFSPHRSSLPLSRTALPDTVRVLALMVEFAEDDDDRTSGNGKFGSIYEYDYGTEILDPLPHDRTYFQNHLLFLENYVRKASGRRTILKAEVLDGIVTLPAELSEYSFRKDESEIPVAQLAVDAWTLAGEVFPSFRFGDYHMFVLFHAGRGRDIDMTSIQGFDPTPLDIPSLSFTMDSFRRLLGASFDGILMPDGFRIDNCAVLPTTNIREIPYIDGSRGLLEITINGLLAASFGTWAGLPDLFDTKTGKSGIGRFGLMDGEGIFAYGGICPPEPNAWEKQQLGWTVPREATPGNRNYILAASDTISTPDVLRVPITHREYWLIENRQRDLGGNGQLVTFVSGGQVQQLRFPKDTLGFENSNVQQLKGVIIDVEDLDWSLPGGRVLVDDNEARINGGILIWHIDEEIIEHNLATNTVNTGRGIRGVDLEQAGGPQDIGIAIQTVFGEQTGTGTALDYWTFDNISPVYEHRFDMYSLPNSRANNGAFTHVTIDGFSPSGPIMTLDVARGDNSVEPVRGWPVTLFDENTHISRQPAVQTADLDGDGEHELLVSYASPVSTFMERTAPVDTVTLHVLRQDGTPFLPGGSLVFEDPAARFISPVVIGDWNNDGITELAIVTRDSSVQSPTRLWILKPADSKGDGRFDVHERIDVPTVLAMPALVGNRLVFRVADVMTDNLVVISDITDVYPVPSVDAVSSLLDETEEQRRIVAMDERSAILTGGTGYPLVDVTTGVITEAHYSVRSAGVGHTSVYQGGAAAAGDMDGDGMLEAVVADVDLVIASNPTDQNIPEFASSQADHALRHIIFQHASMADVDGDGRLDAVFSDGNSVRVLNYSLSSVDNYPAPYPVRFTLAADPGSGNGHALFGIGEDRIWQFSTGARQADGFPIPLPRSADVVLFRNHDNRLALAAAAPDGTVFTFRTGNTITDEQLIWRSRYGDERNSAAVTRAFSTPPPGREFFPLERCYNWPNPVYDEITYIRIYAADDADVHIRIYDLAGDTVDEISAQIAGGTDNDIPWYVGAIQSDTYLAHVVVTSPEGKGEKIIKIAVVK
ncbi:MAG: hypothetical protein KFH87_09445, partial [Bacteroidetes bacterium]|nr:hypothetical protein [Bacteroidota bacterium]